PLPHPHPQGPPPPRREPQAHRRLARHGRRRRLTVAPPARYPRAMPAPLAQNIQWLSARLAEVESSGARAEVERARAASASMLDTGALDPALASLDADAIHGALKLLTIRFHLRNKAEQVHIARVNRRRERDATPESPRPESLDEAVGALA